MIIKAEISLYTSPVRASASGAQGHDFTPAAIPKMIIMVLVATLLGAPHYKASTRACLS